jgi:hypothetical protein
VKEAMKISQIESQIELVNIAQKDLPMASGMYVFHDHSGAIVTAGIACDMSSNCGPNELHTSVRHGRMLLKVKSYGPSFTKDDAKLIVKRVREAIKA